MNKLKFLPSLLLLIFHTVVPSAFGSTSTTTTLVSNQTAGDLGSLFVLTAAVKSAANSAVTVGSVKFYSGTSLLGTSQIVSTASGGGVIGTAVWRTRFLPLGANKITAHYSGPDGPSTSAVVVVTVKGAYPTTTVLSSIGSNGRYDLTATVHGDGPINPTGTASFTDTTANPNVLLGTATLDESTAAYSFTSGASLSTGNSPQGIVIGDFNEDGLVDLAVCNASDNTIGIFLGNGSGTFGTQVSFAEGGDCNYLRTADFNGDGHIDLAVSNGDYDDTFSILLGNGDGSFKGPSVYAVGTGGSGESGLAMADFNGDGILDLVFTNRFTGLLSIFLGEGDGTFKVAGTLTVGNTPLAPAQAGDFNGDGNQDIAVSNYGDGTISVLLGNGDGTFQIQSIYLTGAGPSEMIVGDFNLDGKLDIAVSDTGQNAISVLLGNGDGTFKAAQDFAVGSNPGGLAAADLNGDNRLDLLAVNTGDGTLSVLYSNGDGTFQNQLVFPLQSSISIYHGGSGIGVGDFNSDGTADIATANSISNTVSVLLGQVSVSAKLSNALIVGSGDHLVQGAYSGDANYAASDSNLLDLAAISIAPVFGTMQFSPAATEPYGTSQSIIISDTLSYSGPHPTGAVAYVLNSVSYTATCTTSGSPETCSATVPAATIATLPAASYTVTGSFAGDSNYTPTTAPSGTFVIAKASPLFGTMTFSPASTEPYATRQSVTISDTLAYSAGQPTGAVAYVLNGVSYPATCTKAGSPETCSASVPSATIAALPTAPYFVTASFAGDSDYATATGPSGTFTVTKATPVFGAMTFSPASTEPLGTNLAVTISDTLTFSGAQPAGAVTYSLDGVSYPAICTTAGSPETCSATVPAATIAGLAAAVYPVTGSFAGDSDYTPASAASGSFTITPPAATPVFSVPAGTYATPQTVTISDATAGATIYYTTNGTTPTTGSAVYSGAITVSSSETLEAIATASGYSQSAVASATYTIMTATPTFSVPAGTYTTTQNVAILDSTAGATIHYTTNGTTPTASSAVYTGPLNVSTTETLMATALAPGDSQSAVAAATYTIVPSTTTGLTSSVNPQLLNTPVTFSAVVKNTGTAAVPSGNVTFFDGSTSLGTAPLDASGATSLTTSTLSLGQHSITASFQSPTGTFQSSVSAVLTETINAYFGDFSISASPQSAAIDTGESAQFQATLVPLSGWTQPVTMSCSQLPADTTCSFSPGTVAGANGTTSLLIQTAPPQQIAEMRKSDQPRSRTLVGLGVTGLALVFFPLIRRPSRLRRCVLAFMMACIIGSLSACGANPAAGGTPPGTYIISVTATFSASGQTVVHRAPVTLVVKSLF